MAQNVIGFNKKVTGSIVRINNATQYAVGDVVNGSNLIVPITFTSSRIADSHGWIVGGRCVSSHSGTTQPNFDLLLFSSSSGLQADNAAFNPGFGYMKDYLGRVRFQTWTSLTSEMFSDGFVETAINYIPVTGSKEIYGVPIAQNTYTPASEEEIQFSLDVEQY